MNYLAHAYLSYGEPSILVGNMIGDFVRGKSFNDLPDAVAKGIRMHRAIDQFTDHHAVTKKARSFFQQYYGRYSAVFMDVVYDHFLATDPVIFPGNTLYDFTIQTYAILETQQKVFPPLFARLLPYMISQNWLWGYRSKEGISRSFAGITRRAKYLSSPHPPSLVLDTYYQDLNECYLEFFPALIRFSREYLQLSG
jgi:acyl carrier protein phosphodiesterase